jgi:TAP-like protein
MHSLVQEQEAVSGMADGFISKTWPCAQWKMTAAERYSGSFEAKANFPIMFVNGQYDPCTPLKSAHDASAMFEGSVVLTHGGHGHKFIRHPSICTAKAVRAYFVNGTMPDEGTFCEADVGAFEVASAGGEGASSEVDGALRARGVADEGDRRLLSRMLEFGSLDKGVSGALRRW